MIEVEVNGIIHEFPEGTSRDTIKSALQKRYASKAKKGFLDRVGEDYARRDQYRKRSDQLVQTGAQFPIEGVYQKSMEGVGSAFDLAGEVAVTAFRGLPDYIEGPARAVGRGAASLGKGALKMAGNLPSLAGGTIGERLPGELAYLSEKASEFSEEHPRAAANLRATGIGVLAAPQIRAIKSAAPAVKSGLKSVLNAPRQYQSMSNAGALSRVASTQTDKKALGKVYKNLRADYPDDVEFRSKLLEVAKDRDMSLSDIAGKKTEGLALGAAQYPSGSAITETALGSKQSGIASRLLSSASKNIHSDKDYYGTVEDILKVGRKRASPLYKKAYSANKSVQSKEIDNILSTPAGRKALKDTAKIMQNDRSLMALPDKELKAIQRDLSAIGKMDEVQGPIASGLNLRTLDSVKKNMDEQISKLYRSGDKYEGDVLNDLKNSLVRELDAKDSTGAYKLAREKAGDYLSVSKAIENGRDFMKQDADALKRYFSALSPAEKEAFKTGVVRRVRDSKGSELIRPGDFRLGDKLTDNQTMLGRLKAIMPEKEFNAFKGDVMKEKRLVEYVRKVLGGSNTTSKQYAARELDAAGRGVLEEVANQGAIATGRKAIVGIVRKAYDFLGDAKAKKVANIIYEQDPAKKLALLKELEKMSGGQEAVRAYADLYDRLSSVREKSLDVAAGVSANVASP